MYVNFWIAWFSSCSIMWYVISRREYVNLGSYRGIFQQYMLPKIRFNLYMVEDLHQNYLYIFAVDFVFSFFFWGFIYLNISIVVVFFVYCVWCRYFIYYLWFLILLCVVFFLSYVIDNPCSFQCLCKRWSKLLWSWKKCPYVPNKMYIFIIKSACYCVVIHKH